MLAVSLTTKKINWKGGCGGAVVWAHLTPEGTCKDLKGGWGRGPACSAVPPWPHDHKMETTENKQF